MTFKESIRTRICLPRITPNYPVGDFDRWVKDNEISLTKLLCSLNELQMELELETQMLQLSDGGDATKLLQLRYWCFYCEQARTYYRTLINHPELEGCLGVIRDTTKQV